MYYWIIPRNMRNSGKVLVTVSIKIFYDVCHTGIVILNSHCDRLEIAYFFNQLVDAKILHFLQKNIGDILQI